MPSIADKKTLTREQDRRYKTTKADLEEMRKLKKQGLTNKEIAKRFGISSSTVSYIVNENARQTLREYRLKNPPKRRTTEEAREYAKSLRQYKKKLIAEEQEKMDKSFGGFSVYSFKNYKSKKEKRYSK